jgi:hypothetical protein
LALGEQLAEHFFIKLPWPVLIGVGQRGTRGSLRQTQMPQLAFARRQSTTNFAQRLGRPELTEQHGHKLSPTAEAAGMPFGFMLANRRVKSSSRNQL